MIPYHSHVGGVLSWGLVVEGNRPGRAGQADTPGGTELTERTGGCPGTR